MALILQRRCLCSFRVCFSHPTSNCSLVQLKNCLLTYFIIVGCVHTHCDVGPYEFMSNNHSNARKYFILCSLSICSAQFDAFWLQPRCHSKVEKLHRTRKNDNQTKRTLTINENSSIILVEYRTCK